MTGARILVVEDEWVLARHLRERLAKFGYQVVADVQSGAAALAHVHADRPDLVLMDINIKGDLDGIETASQIPAEFLIPVVYLTAYWEGEVLDRARATRPYGYLLKPFSDKELHATIQMALERHVTDQAARDSAERLRLALDAAEMGSWELNCPSRKILYSGAPDWVFGAPEPGVPGTVDDFLARMQEEDRPAVGDMLDKMQRSEALYDVQFRSTGPDDDLRWFRLRGKAFGTAPGQTRRLIGVVQDITKERQNAERLRQVEEDLRHLAHHDPLTGLPNRLLAIDRLDHALELARRRGEQVGILFIDLDRFKHVNDMLGHGAGDELLRTVARRMRTAVRSSDTVARLGGDEFMVILDRVSGPDDVASVARKILASLAPPVALAGTQASAAASIGISLFPHDGSNCEELIRAADTAMYVAKERGTHSFAFHASEMTRDYARHASLEHDLRRGLAQHELRLHYQPQYSIATGGIVGLEALIRWQHPNKGLLGAGDVITVAERSGLIVEIGDWVLREACRQISHWRLSGLPPLRVAVNVSPRQLRGNHLLDTVSEALAQTKVPADLLEIEVTETALQTCENLVATLDSLRNLGVSLAIDDFGTGYSCLGALKALPVHRLKIDRIFIAGIPDDSDNCGLTEAIVAVAKRLGMGVVAEGIETEAQEHFLRALDCEEGQGFLYARPMPPGDVAELMRHGRALQRGHG